jgi:hypothetical protein
MVSAGGAVFGGVSGGFWANAAPDNEIAATSARAFFMTVLPFG